MVKAFFMRQPFHQHGLWMFHFGDSPSEPGNPQKYCLPIAHQPFVDVKRSTTWFPIGQ